MEVQLFLSLIKIGPLLVHVYHLVGLFNRVDEIIRFLEEVLVILRRINDIEFLIQIEVTVNLVREHHVFLGGQCKLF